MGHGVRIPTFRQHRHRHHTPNRFTQPSGLANRVHHFPQQVLIADVLTICRITTPLHQVSSKAIDFIRRHLPESRIQCLARL